MSYRIKITVDEQLNETIKARAKQMGLSVSSYVRLVLVSVLPKKGNKLLDKAIENVRDNSVESLTLAEFNHQIDHL